MGAAEHGGNPYAIRDKFLPEFCEIKNFASWQRKESEGITQREALAFIDRLGTNMCEEIRGHIDVNRARPGQGNWLILTKMRVYFRGEASREARWTTVLAIWPILDEQPTLKINDV